MSCFRKKSQITSFGSFKPVTFPVAFYTDLTNRLLVLNSPSQQPT